MATETETQEPRRVELLGARHTVTLPNFAAREELLVAYHEVRERGGVVLLRVYSAALGLCTRLGKQSGADYGKHRFDVLAYGGEVYAWLRGQGLTASQIAQAGQPVILDVAEAVFPSADEVSEAKGN